MNIILQIVNIFCTGLTVVGALILGQKGDKLSGWLFYIVASTLGIIYFSFTGDGIQLFLWIFFFTNNLLAIRRKRNEKREKNEHETPT